MLKERKRRMSLTVTVKNMCEDIVKSVFYISIFASSIPIIIVLQTGAWFIENFMD